jgi:AbrB family looped-hinge helix DNA binding protein
MELSRITVKGQITLPASMRKRLGLATGQPVMFEATPEGILVKPVKVEDLTQTLAWKMKLKAALAEAQAGQGSSYDSGEEFMNALENKFKRKSQKKTP